MEGLATASPTVTGRLRLHVDFDDNAKTPVASGFREHFRPLGILLVLTAALHVWLLTHTEVPARDSIGYIRYAWQLEHDGWRDVIRGSEHHPGYPLAVLAMSVPVRWFVSGSDPITMQLSAQLVSALAGLLLVLPMYFLGRELFDRRVAFWATLSFQCLPAASRVLADALSEATFLLLAVTALWLAVRALRTYALWQFALCGLFGGLAYLTRPEGAVIVASAGLALITVQHRAAWRKPWRRVTAAALSLGLPALLVAIPFALVVGKASSKPGIIRLFNALFRIKTAEESNARSDRPLMASTFAVWIDDMVDPATSGKHPAWAVRALAQELIKGFYYVGWLPALLALWWFRARFRDIPGIWALLILCLTIGLAVWAVATTNGYVSDRHLLLILLIGCYWMVAGLIELPRRLGALGERLAVNNPRLRRLLNPLRRLLLATDSAVVTAVLLLAATAMGLPKSLEPLHHNRGGFREAGLWLAEHSEPNDEVIDPYCWSHYYAGRVFTESRGEAASGVRYVVLEENSASPHTRLPRMEDAVALKQHGKEVYRWAGKRGKGDTTVVVYEVR